ncbi:hypothetical protein AWN90_07465 [Nocardia terpenica]|uniref:Uncharacterized protein n=1 Tax=Nocardia terpenica TaxID=455432 RepID=A0A164INS9_9NOCA|nr:hypothetical protein AWN90_07465 [Nocardia terpenica]
MTGGLALTGLLPLVFAFLFTFSFMGSVTGTLFIDLAFPLPGQLLLLHQFVLTLFGKLSYASRLEFVSSALLLVIWSGCMVVLWPAACRFWFDGEDDIRRPGDCHSVRECAGGVAVVHFTDPGDHAWIDALPEQSVRNLTDGSSVGTYLLFTTGEFGRAELARGGRTLCGVEGSPLHGVDLAVRFFLLPHHFSAQLDRILRGFRAQMSILCPGRQIPMNRMNAFTGLMHPLDPIQLPFRGPATNEARFLIGAEVQHRQVLGMVSMADSHRHAVMRLPPCRVRFRVDARAGVIAYTPTKVLCDGLDRSRMVEPCRVQLLLGGFEVAFPLELRSLGDGSLER